MHDAARCCGLALLAISILTPVSLTAQRTGIPGTASPGPNPAATGIVRTPSQTTQSTTPGQFPEAQMPIFLSGRVLMDDGTAPATSIPIQRICSGAPRTVAFTNPSGQFSFQWGSPAGFAPDASDGTTGLGMGTNGPRAGQTGGDGGGANLLGCELFADAPGFRSARLNLSGHRASDNPDLGAIILHRIAGLEGTFISATALNAPKDARKAWEKGVQYLHKSKFGDAQKELEKAVDIYPKYANAWLDLGRARMQQKAPGPAREAFLKAIDADGKLVEPYVELGKMASREQSWPDAARYLDRALQLDPVDYPRLWFEDAVADYHVQNFDRAERNAREALKLPPTSRDPHAHQLLGLILMNKQDYAGAGVALRAYVALAPKAKDLDQVRSQLEQIDRRLAITEP